MKQQGTLALLLQGGDAQQSFGATLWLPIMFACWPLGLSAPFSLLACDQGLIVFWCCKTHVSLLAGRFEIRGKSFTRCLALIISVLGPLQTSCQSALLQYSYFPMDEEYLWLSAINQGLYLGYVLYIFLGTARHVSLLAGRFETRGKSVTRYFALIISVLGPWQISCQLALLQYSYFPMDEEYLWQSAINQGLFLSYILYIFLVLQDTCFSAGWKI